MIRARLWIAEKLLAVARAIANERSAPEEPEEDDVEVEVPTGGAVLGPEAIRMLLEGEAAAELALEKSLAESRAAHEPEPARAGSLRERIETARRNA